MSVIAATVREFNKRGFYTRNRQDKEEKHKGKEVNRKKKGGVKLVLAQISVLGRRTGASGGFGVSQNRTRRRSLLSFVKRYHHREQSRMPNPRGEAMG